MTKPQSTAAYVLRLTLTLFLITVIVAGLLAFVNYLTADTIAEHTAEAARSAMISHSGTASLGANCTREDFRAQFAGKTGELAVSKDGGDIDALTGATVTSRAVTRAVNAALAYAGEVQK